MQQVMATGGSTSPPVGSHMVLAGTFAPVFSVLSHGAGHTVEPRWSA